MTETAQGELDCRLLWVEARQHAGPATHSLFWHRNGLRWGHDLTPPRDEQSTVVLTEQSALYPSIQVLHVSWLPAIGLEDD